MPPRDPSLPEGTDHIIDTNIDLGPDTTGGGGGSGGGSSSGVGGAGTGGLGGASSGGAGGSASMGSSGTANVGSSSGPTGTTGDGGSTSSSGTTGTSGGSGGSAFQFDKKEGGNGGSKSSNSISSGIMGQVKDQISSLKSQAGDRARTLADDGKSQATSFLQTVAQIVADASGSVEDRLGSQYSGFGTRASDSIKTLASSLDDRSIDDLLEDARAFVQRSPAAAIGIAAVIGFAVARVMRASITEYRGVDTSDGTDNGGASGAMTTGGAAGGTGGLNATSGAFGETGVGTAGNVGGTGTSTGAGSTGGTGNAPTV